MPSGSNLKLNLYLKHFNETVIHSVLDETGYKSLIDYEMYCRHSDVFPIYFDYNGLMTAEYRALDPTIWRVFEFSIHHLQFEVRTLILEKYIGMSQIDYETQYPEYNNIYVYVPYKSCFNQSSTDYTYSQYLSGWYFRLNKRTGKSYVLYRREKVVGVFDGYIQYSDGSTMDSIWNVQLTGLDHPLYYNAKSKGFLIGTRFREQLLNYGAVFEDDDVEKEYSHYEPDESLRGWQYWVNPNTLNSFLLAPVDSDFVKVEDGYAYFGNEKYPTKWTPHGMILTKPFYFSKSHQAWIVSSDLEERLLDLGANMRCFFEQDESTDTVPLCERFAKQETKSTDMMPLCERFAKQETKSTSKVAVEQEKLLCDMKFTLNTKTQNSYILSPREQITSTKGDYVYSGSKKYKKHLTYDVMGEEKTFYYNDNFNGWIISLKHQKWLLDNGAKLF